MKLLLSLLAGLGLALALLVSFGIDFQNTARGGAIDLRNQITGARLLAAHLDPYHYKWTRAQPDIYCDPYNNPNLPVSKTTTTPPLLAVHLPLAFFPYRTAQFGWFYLQWLLLLGTGMLWLLGRISARQRWLVALFLVGLTYTASWRLHVERGQCYVVLLFVFAGWLKVTLHPKWGNHFCAGLLAGFLMALRPSFAVLIPFLALHRRGQLAGTGVGFLAAAVLPLTGDPGGWLHYAMAMQTQSLLYRIGDVTHYHQAYPPQIEGMPTGLLAHYVAIPFADFSVHRLLSWLGCGLFSGGPVMLAALVAFTFWLGFSRRSRLEDGLVGMAAWCFIIDLFLPAYRNSYNDVMILNVVAGAILTSPKIPWTAWLGFAALPVGWIVYGLTLDQAALINLPALLFTAAAVTALFVFDNSPGARKVNGAC